MKLKSELVSTQITILKQRIVKHFKHKPLLTKDGSVVVSSIGQAEALFGLPYTSSSSCAGLWVTNTEAWLDIEKKWRYEGFSVTEEGIPVAIIWDNSSPEQEILLAL